MSQKDSDVAFVEAKDQVHENLDSIQLGLVVCIDQGMMDLEDTLYNQVLGLLEDVAEAGNWDELEELISQAKILETDIAAWLSMHGRSSYSLPWPSR